MLAAIEESLNGFFHQTMLLSSKISIFLYFIEIRQCIGITETYTEIIFILQFLGFWFDIN